jgi:DNA-directed RNA polymerase specialized sigma24 family protein
MTTEEYGSAYMKGYVLTARLLVTRGLSWDGAQETAQAAWARGWEKRGQLRDANTLMKWINTIALNIYRSSLRREPFLQDIPEIAAPPEGHLAAIDVQLILQTCKKKDRIVLESYYLEDSKPEEIARAQGSTVTAIRLRLLRARRGLAKTLTIVSRPTTKLALAKSANA